ncbi:MAG: ABC transporter substrate-binding protein [Rhodospirillaceae bacterium]|nr:ABC transporter substrate-binding protein [Rhodospirillaceae bacterium]|tara:strand:- start:894 stop:2096 length:1203 start_codon:yes stop_codon:yes gene_type:complete
MRLLILILFINIYPASFANAKSETWERIVTKSQGQTVYWNAWGGDERINSYINWAGAEVKKNYGVSVKHVKLLDTSEAVSRVLAEKAAGRSSEGSIDLIWINGENFAAMKKNKLLFGPWTSDLPNYHLVDTIGKKTTTIDFTIPVEGLEAPWGMAQFVFMYDSKFISSPPMSIKKLLAWAKNNKGRFTYPQPPNFLGTTFLKQALIELIVDKKSLQREVDYKSFHKVTQPLWSYLDNLHPFLWRSGKIFPQNGPAQNRLLGDNEIDISLSFEPSEASSLISTGAIPNSVRTFVLSKGTVGNTSFLAIPFNAKSKEGAQVLVNFLMSPYAQARKQNPLYWGNGTVLDMNKLKLKERDYFTSLSLGVATLSPESLGNALLEPHPSWVNAIEKTWSKRYAIGK